MNYRYDYSQTMMMKLGMARPDRRGGSEVFCGAAKALEIIRQVDNMTLGTPKIIYLVGWQYLGHDDKYPAFFEVNEGIKRREDKSALDSLLWLIEEAKKYHTVVSLHINFTDAYADSPLFVEYSNANALIRNGRGKPAAIENYNGKACYKISYKEEWESGLFKRRVDKLFEMLPVAAVGTVHVDNFQCYMNRKPYVSAEEMHFYRLKMINYLREKGVDITSEFTYREGKGSAVAYGKVTRDFTPRRYPIACLGRIPAVWWADKLSLEEYFAYYPHVYGGGIPKDNRALNLFYGNVHAEELFETENWHKEFVRQFCVINVPFFYLNAKKRVGFTDKKMREVIYSDATLARADGKIFAAGETVKNGRLKVGKTGKIAIGKSKVFLPYREGYIAYCDESCDMSAAIKLKIESVTVSEITPEGLIGKGNVPVRDGKIFFSAEGGKAYYIETVAERK